MSLQVALTVYTRIAWYRRGLGTGRISEQRNVVREAAAGYEMEGRGGQLTLAEAVEAIKAKLEIDASLKGNIW